MSKRHERPLAKAYRFVRGVTLILVGYALSVVVLMTLRATVFASLPDGTWHAIFATWVLATLAVLGFLFGS